MLAMVGEDIIRETEEWRKNVYSSANEAWYKNMERSIKHIEEHLRNAPPSITFGPPLDLPADLDIDLLSDENKDEVKKLIEPFELSQFKNIWAFVSKQNKEKILDILKA